ncbi:Fat storage-inducing transmembrane protein [Scheffersomyces coipomensis]|uniref:Fat storage-inducing transmembrane protein n=1 Tax=Scheffersomyces coipomensis TaxID=1788519 RepID=UPI00315C9705
MLKLRGIITGSYVVVFLATIPSFLLLKIYASVVGSNPLVSFFEDYIIKSYGYVWFTLVYFSFLFLYIQTDYRISNNKVLEFVRNYSLNTLVFITTQVWFFGSSIFERINIATGGSCADDSIRSEYYCKSSGSTWTNGFDASGHFYFILSVSLIVWRELLNHLGIQSKIPMANGDELEFDQAPGNNSEIASASWNNNPYLTIYKAIVIGVALTFLSIWYFMYLITCIFFHTIPEKIVGTAVGLFIPLLIAYIDSY